jgi:hypothetical protein
MNTIGFADTEKIRLAYLDIKRYQSAYLKANKKPILVRWKLGWYCIGKEPSIYFKRPTEFRNMIDRLESIARDSELDKLNGRQHE